MNANSLQMKLLNWLNSNTKKLEQAGISTARLDCLVLLEDALNRNCGWLLSHHDYDLDNNTLKLLEEQVLRRFQHEPLAYIRGKSDFYGREFIVNHHTLQPRPETETMIELLQNVIEDEKRKAENLKTPTRKPTAKQHLYDSDATQSENEQWIESYVAHDEEAAAKASTKQPSKRAVSFSGLTADQENSTMTIVDVGTGSGCIAITAKLLYPEAHVIGIDIDSTCLSTARQNTKKYNTDIDLLEGNLVEPLSNLKYHISSIILGNLPYVPSNYTINQSAMHEPRHAIFGGYDGLDYYRSLFSQLQLINIKPRFIFTEAMPPQHDSLENIAQLHNYELVKKQDFIQVFSPVKTTISKNT